MTAFYTFSAVNAPVALDGSQNWPVYIVNWTQSGVTQSLVLAWNDGSISESTFESGPLAGIISGLSGSTGVSSVVLTRYDVVGTQLSP